MRSCYFNVQTCFWIKHWWMFPLPFLNFLKFLHQRLKSAPAKHWKPLQLEREMAWSKVKTLPDTWAGFKIRVLAGCCCVRMPTNATFYPINVHLFGNESNTSSLTTTSAVLFSNLKSASLRVHSDKIRHCCESTHGCALVCEGGVKKKLFN